MKSSLIAVMAGLCIFLTSTTTYARYTVVEDSEGKHWFQDDEGNRFLSLGVNTVLDVHDFQAPEGSTYYDPVPEKFEGNWEAWQDSTINILKSASFNTIGAWSTPETNDGQLYDTPILYVAEHDKLRMFQSVLPGFKEKVKAKTKSVLSEFNHHEKIIGVFLDNEMAWFGASPWTDNPYHTILEESFKPDQPAEYRQVSLDFLKEKYSSPSELSAAWSIPIESWDDVTFENLKMGRSDEANKSRSEFIAYIAYNFYRKSTEAVRELYPDFLILGTRFAGNAPTPVIEACGKYCDVLSFNHYRGKPEIDSSLLARHWLIGGKPMMITEFSWRADENTSGNPNTGGAGAVLKTQAERGERYQAFLEDAFSYPALIGMHWFQYSDQSPQGRFDGENSNYGVVDIYDRPYTQVLEHMKTINDESMKIHQTTTRPMPDTLPKDQETIISIGQYPDRPPVVDLLQSPAVAPIEVFTADDANFQLTEEEGAYLLKFDTAEQWGGGISFSGPVSNHVEKSTPPAIDIDGYTSLVFEADVPINTEFHFVLDEAAVGNPGSMSFDSTSGDDGESFILPSRLGDGKKETYRFELADLRKRSVWGNQEGGRRVDFSSVKGFALVIPGSQGSGTATIYSLRLEK